MPWLRHLFASPRFNSDSPCQICGGQVTQRQVPLQVLQFPLASTVPSVLYTLYRHYTIQATDRALLNNALKINKKEGNIPIYTSWCDAINEEQLQVVI
jgi:hypothetical protein